MPKNWTASLKTALLSCRSDAELADKFPDQNLQTLKRRQREFRAEAQLTSEPEDLYRVYQKRERLEIRGLADGTRIVVTSDYQIPHVDYASLAAVEDFIDDFQPDIDVIAGDALDEEHLSVFTKNPTANFTLNDEMRIGRTILTRRRKRNPKARMIWLDGNHEDRLIREMWKRLPDLYELDNGEEQIVTIPNLLNFHKLDVEHLNYRSLLDIEGFQIVHGWLTGANVAKRMYAHMLSSGASGHTHTLGQYHTSGANGDHAWYELGCLCRLDPDWTKSSYPGWTQGFLYAVVHNHKLHCRLVPIYSDGFYAEGKFYKREAK